MMKITVALLFLAIPHSARAQVAPHFTAQHIIQFVAGTDPVRKLLSGDPSLRDMVARDFVMAREDLNDDGSKEMIVIATDSMWCGSGGCATVVLEMRAGKIVTILSQNLAGSLAVTNEKIGQYRALAAVDDAGAIVAGDRPGTPLFRKQLVYPMNVSEAAPSRQATPPTPTGASVCGSQPLCSENLEFAAAITDFRAILENKNNKTLTVRMSLRNKLNRPLVLGYVSRSGIATDDRGNRYVPSGERAIQGIGQISGNSADSKFALQPGESSDARFEFTWYTSGQEIFGLTFQLDLAIREIAQLPGNQTQLGREYALHFARLGNSPASMTAASPRPIEGAPRPPSSGAAPVPPAAAAPQVDACSGKPRCYSTGLFVAEVTGMTPSFAMYNNLHMLQAKVRFRNLTNQPITLAYVADSAVIVDNYGGRYSSRNTNYGEGAKGIGIVQRNEADPQFVLGPGASDDATFTLSRKRNVDKSDPMGSTFNLDLTIAQLEVLASQQIRTTREYSVGFTGLSTSAVSGIAPSASGPAPSTPGAAAPQADACAGKPRCYSAGLFVAEVMGMTPSFAMSNNLHMLQVKVRFRNLTDQQIILAYVADSAVIVDNYGGRYSSRNSNYGEGAKGIGIAQRNAADPQFVLRPAASADATFTLSRRYDKSGPMGATFGFEVAIVQLELLASQQIRTVREYAVTIPNLTASGNILNQILQGIPKKRMNP